MLRNIIARLDDSRANKTRVDSHSQWLFTAHIVKFAYVIRLLMCIKVAVPFYIRFYLMINVQVIEYLSIYWMIFLITTLHTDF